MAPVRGAPIEQATCSSTVFRVILQHLAAGDSFKHFFEGDYLLHHLLLGVLGNSKDSTRRLCADPGKNPFLVRHIEFVH
jgi:hypothetical protein